MGICLSDFPCEKVRQDDSSLQSGGLYGSQALAFGGFPVFFRQSNTRSSGIFQYVHLSCCSMLECGNYVEHERSREIFMLDGPLDACAFLFPGTVGRLYRFLVLSFCMVYYRCTFKS